MTVIGRSTLPEEGHNVAVTLKTCRHCFCLHCLDRHKSTSAGGSSPGTYRCPVCRTDFTETGEMTAPCANMGTITAGGTTGGRANPVVISDDDDDDDVVVIEISSDEEEAGAAAAAPARAGADEASVRQAARIAAEANFGSREGYRAYELAHGPADAANASEPSLGAIRQWLRYDQFNVPESDRSGKSVIYRQEYARRARELWDLHQHVLRSDQYVASRRPARVSSRAPRPPQWPRMSTTPRSYSGKGPSGARTGGAAMQAPNGAESEGSDDGQRSAMIDIDMQGRPTSFSYDDPPGWRPGWRHAQDTAAAEAAAASKLATAALDALRAQGPRTDAVSLSSNIAEAGQESANATLNYRWYLDELYVTSEGTVDALTKLAIDIINNGVVEPAGLEDVGGQAVEITEAYYDKFENGEMPTKSELEVIEKKVEEILGNAPSDED